MQILLFYANKEVFKKQKKYSQILGSYTRPNVP